MKNDEPVQSEYSDKEGIRILIELLIAKGVRYAVLSPGSRNAPLLISFAREERIRHYVIADERSAAFFALGLAQQSGEPVVIICTSGTALLNYAPAVAEAWYQRIPLIVVSADRPIAWIDQDDSQTIRQNGALSNVVKASWLLPVELENEETRWYANRIINDALNCALKGRKGPVHLNIPLGEPLYGTKKYPQEPPRAIRFLDSAPRLEDDAIISLKNDFFNSPGVMIVAGFGASDKELQTELEQLSEHSNVIILTENISNLDNANYITTIDRVLSSIPENRKKEFAPDLLISFGGALVSRQLKTFLRNHPPRQHWTIDNSEFPADTFKHLTTQINLEARDFFKQLGHVNRQTESSYAVLWQQQDKIATRQHEAFIHHCPWSDLKAFASIMPALPTGSSLQVSNGTPVRYAQLFKHPQVQRRAGNRGTSGIEGATSVAVGSSCLTNTITTLITGDISFLYDSNALWNPYITPRLKIIVMKNGGGGIFRFIPGPGDLQELEECFETAQDVNIRGFAEIHHFQYDKAVNEQELEELLPVFFKTGERASILEIETPRFENGRILKDYFTNLSKKY